jgi:predicted esterase YcpF (UPF0227 family)
MIIFYHGYNSSNQTNKFTEINTQEKFCRSVNYDESSYEEIYKQYCKDIEEHKPDILIGHSLGGYWAIKMANKYNLPVVLVNPSFFPEESLPQLNYHNIEPRLIQNNIPKYFYLELGDEVLDLEKLNEYVKDYSYVETVSGGHHRVQYINNYIQVIEFAINTCMIEHTMG